MPEISERELSLPDAVIGKLLKIANENKSVISLGPGEPDFSLPKPLVKYIPKLANKSNHYAPPGGRQELINAMLKKLKKDNNIKTNPENVIITTGSQEALLLATACTLDVSEQIIIPDPSYMGFLPTFRLFNAQPVPLPIYEEDKFDINPDNLKKLIDKKKTKAILINSPANPTGNVLNKKILEQIADIAIDNDLYIFSDEAYEKIIYDKKHYSIGSFNGMKKYAVSFYSFSKTYAMCGFRVGACVGPENLIKEMTKCHTNSTISAPTLSQLLAVKALSLSNKYTLDMVKEYNRRRKLIVKRLNDLNFHTPTPNGAFYTFSNIKDYSKNSFKFANELLTKAKVAVMPGREFGVNGEGYIRCSYATDYKKIELAMDRLEKYIDKRK